MSSQNAMHVTLNQYVNRPEGMSRRLTYNVLIFLCLLMGVPDLNAQVPAFPGAEGYGAYAKGGRGGDVFTVTNLNDSGRGSLRYGIESAAGPRTIVFALSGIIKLKSPLLVDKDYITIAGQSAPGDGICLRDAALVVDANHVIIRYLRSRLGSESGKESDAISINGGRHIIVDHCSASWSVDEVFSCSTGTPGKIDSVSVQWCIISEALNNSIHKKGAHGYGALIRGCGGVKYSYHHNLFAHNYSRNPRPGNYNQNNRFVDPEGLLFDFRNNVMYNWGGSRPGYDSDKESVCMMNYVGNVGIPGPDSDPTGFAYSAGCKHFRAYFEQNKFYGSIPGDQWKLVDFSGEWTKEEVKIYKQYKPFGEVNVYTHHPDTALTLVLAHAGASLNRDPVDQRVVQSVHKQTGSIINDQKEVGSWPSYKTDSTYKDSDLDGIPDDWEKKKGLNPKDKSDRNEDPDGDGYTNLEEYLNGLLGS